MKIENISSFIDILGNSLKEIKEKPAAVIEDNPKNTKSEVDEKTNTVIYKTYRKKELLYQFPTQDILKLRQYALDLQK
jgi:hypothetical protein